MLYTDSSFKPNPIASGYQVQFFVGYGETGQDTAAATNLGFESGSGRFFVQNPLFEVTGLAFLGKTFLQRPTGVGRRFVRDFIDFSNKANLTCFLSGDFNGETGLGLTNVKRLEVFTGANDNFSADVVSGFNRIRTIPTNLSRDNNKITIPISRSDIDNRVDEPIGFQVVPRDFINYGTRGISITGEIFGGFESFPVITGIETEISRQTMNDIRFSIASRPVEINPPRFPCTILVDSGICLDFDADFRIRGTGNVIVTGINGAVITGTKATIDDSNTHTSRNSITFSGLNLSKFNIGSVIDVIDNFSTRTAFVVNLN